MHFSTTLLLITVLAISTTAAPSPASSGQLESRQSSSTRNDLQGPCKDVIVIYARGTSEAGNVGRIAGPPFFDALNSQLGANSVAVQGVDYPANVAGFLAGGSNEGAQTMARLVSTATSNCPNSKIVLSGYSQGAQVTHKAAAQIPTSLQSRVAAIVLFGDPNNGDPFPGALNNNVRTFCNTGDLICSGAAIVRPPHLTYGRDGPAAARFVAARV